MIAATTTMLSVERLRPNGWNPNQMTEEQFAELVEEIRHLERTPRPVVVRPAEQGAFSIVDGEHNWRAAREAGLEEVPCEVIEVDDFEAMRQTYKRNLHGSHNPVRLGRLFREMMAARGLSRRSLGTDINVSEGTIRNALAYADAADLRNRYAASRRGAVNTDVQELSVRQVRAYVTLPRPVGDYWLDASGSLDDLHGTVRVNVGNRQVTLAYDVDAFAELAEADLLGGIKRRGFRRSVRRAFELLAWRREVPAQRRGDVDAYLAPVGRLGLPVRVIDEYLPAVPSADGEGIEIPLAPERWEEILRESVEKADDPEMRDQLLAASIQAAAAEEVRRRFGEDVELGAELAGPQSDGGGEADPFASRETLTASLLSKLVLAGDEGKVDGRPLADALHARLAELPWPELCLLGGAVLERSPERSLERWCEAMGGGSENGHGKKRLWGRR
jgi:ParB/RepB/Spo0J family partition protein